MLKTAPVLPGVCVGGPEAKTESTESNEEATEVIRTNSSFLWVVRRVCVCVCV